MMLQQLQSIVKSLVVMFSVCVRNPQQVFRSSFTVVTPGYARENHQKKNSCMHDQLWQGLQLLVVQLCFGLGQATRVPTRESLKGNPTQYCISPYCCHGQLLYRTLPNASSDLCRYCCRMSFTCLFAQRDSKLLEIAAVEQEMHLQQHATPSYNYITKM